MPSLNHSAISQTTITGSNGFLSYWVSAGAIEFAPGSLVTLTLFKSSGGTIPPMDPDNIWFDLYIENTTTLIKSFPLASGTPGHTVSFWMTHDGNSTGSSRLGTLRLRIRFRKNTGLSTQQYDVNSDNGTYGSASNVYPTGYVEDTTSAWAGYIRSVQAAGVTLTLSMTQGGANPGLFAYGDGLWERLNLVTQPFTGSPVTFALTNCANQAATVSVAVGNDLSFSTVNNRFPAASGVKTATATIGNSPLTGLPWTKINGGTSVSTTGTVDARITATHLFQQNSNSFQTPPMNGHVGTQRLATDLGFLNTRWTNAKGVGQNGLTYSATLVDANALVDPVARTGVPTTTQGGETGWGSTFLPWSSTLPVGIWTKTVTITAPSGATGLDANKTQTYNLVAANPNYRLIAGGGPATAQFDARHFSPGVPFIAGVAVLDTLTGKKLVLDTGSNPPTVALGRLNLALGRAEFLDSDGVWKPTYVSGAEGIVHYWPTVPSPADPNVHIVVFSDTTLWGVSDIFVVGRAYVGGVPVNDFSKEIAVSGVNNHDRYTFDGPGFLGFPTR